MYSTATTTTMTTDTNKSFLPEAAAAAGIYGAKTISFISNYYGLSPQTKGVRVTADLVQQPCRGCQLHGNLSCPFHAHAMGNLLLKYCNYMDSNKYQDFTDDELFIAETLKNFGAAFMGISYDKYIVRHGQFDIQRDREKALTCIHIDQNDDLFPLFNLDGLRPSAQLPYACVYHQFETALTGTGTKTTKRSSPSRFVCFNDGTYFLMGRTRNKENPGLPLSTNYYDEFIDDFSKELTRTYQIKKCFVHENNDPLCVYTNRS